MGRHYCYFHSETFDVAMAKLRLNLTKLAQRVDIPRPRMSYIAGGFVPDEETQSRIAEALGVDSGELWRLVVETIHCRGCKRRVAPLATEEDGKIVYYCPDCGREF